MLSASVGTSEPVTARFVPGLRLTLTSAAFTICSTPAAVDGTTSVITTLDVTPSGNVAVTVYVTRSPMVRSGAAVCWLLPVPDTLVSAATSTIALLNNGAAIVRVWVSDAA